MAVDDDLRQQVLKQAQGALMLNVAFVGVADGLLDTLERIGAATAEALAAAAEMDAGYTVRWCDAAYAFGLVDEVEADTFALTALGAAFCSDTPGTLMPFAVQSVLNAHCMERAATCAKTGERPGERVLAERPSLAPLFGPMLERTFGVLFDREVLPNVPAFAQVDAQGGLCVDLGCGNGWYLRRLAARHPHVRGIGLDSLEASVAGAKALAAAEGLSDRLDFRLGDLHQVDIDEPAALIAMNRALHHVWDDKANVFRILREHLAPGGVAVIWEPAWPSDRATLREPAQRPMAVQNLCEHVQGNHFLQPNEIVAGFATVGMDSRVYTLAGGREAVVVGTAPF